MVFRTLVCFFAAAIFANAAVIVSMVGDEDALGTGTPIGGMLPLGPFDNRSAAEMAATDGAQNTDVATNPAGGGSVADNTYIHTFTIPAGLSIGSAIVEFGLGGMQSNDSNPATSGIGEDALRVDGVLVPEAFAGVDQGPFGYGIVQIALPSSVLALLGDGQVSLFIDLNGNAGLGPSSRAEPVYYDFSRLTITAIPEPRTIALVALGLVALLLRKRRIS
jgi:hypothetical protein